MIAIGLEHPSANSRSAIVGWRQPFPSHAGHGRKSALKPAPPQRSHRVRISVIAAGEHSRKTSKTTVGLLNDCAVFAATSSISRRLIKRGSSGAFAASINVTVTAVLEL